MKIKELIAKLKEENQENDILVSSDEEFNTLFQKVEVTEFAEGKSCIFGLSGSELEEE